MLLAGGGATIPPALFLAFNIQLPTFNLTG